ncbi:MAG TPA: hypothetical protein VF103_07635 [Polyangiaceae bacterium]
MRKIWCVAFAGLMSLSCRGKGESAPAPSGAASGAPAPGSASPAKAGECLTALDYLVPPQKYGERDLIRALLVDGDQLFFRDMHDLMRVPLAGGKVVTVGKAPALSLRGTTELWQSGADLLMQSPGEPIFMKANKNGGAWSTFIDLTAAKKGGGRDAATRLLQGLGKQAPPAASGADFDGTAFYYAEVSSGKGRTATASSALKSEPLAGGEPRMLYQSPGEISEVTRAGDELVFHLTLPPSDAQLKEQEAQRKAHKFALGVSGEQWIMAVPLAGGQARKLMRLGSIFSGGLVGTSTILGADGNRVYVSGYANEDLAKPGTFRLDANTGASEELDQRYVRGHAYVSGAEVVIIGSGSLEPRKAQHGELVLTVPRQGKSTKLVACLSDKSTLHASAVAGGAALLSLFQTETNLASIARVPIR